MSDEHGERARIVACLRDLANRKAAMGFPTPVPETIRSCADLIERGLDGPPDPAVMLAWRKRLAALLF